MKKLRKFAALVAAITGMSGLQFGLANQNMVFARKSTRSVAPTAAEYEDAKSEFATYYSKIDDQGGWDGKNVIYENNRFYVKCTNGNRVKIPDNVMKKLTKTFKVRRLEDLLSNPGLYLPNDLPAAPPSVYTKEDYENAKAEFTTYYTKIDDQGGWDGSPITCENNRYYVKCTSGNRVKIPSETLNRLTDIFKVNRFENLLSNPSVYLSNSSRSSQNVVPQRRDLPAAPVSRTCMSLQVDNLGQVNAFIKSAKIPSLERQYDFSNMLFEIAKKADNMCNNHRNVSDSSLRKYVRTVRDYNPSKYSILENYLGSERMEYFSYAFMKAFEDATEDANNYNNAIKDREKSNKTLGRGNDISDDERLDGWTYDKRGGAEGFFGQWGIRQITDLFWAFYDSIIIPR